MSHLFEKWKNSLGSVLQTNQKADLLISKKIAHASLIHFVAWKDTTKRFVKLIYNSLCFFYSLFHRRQRNRSILQAIQQQRQKVTVNICLLEWHRVAKNNAIVRGLTRMRIRRIL